MTKSILHDDIFDNTETIKTLKDIYNDLSIMTLQPPYPYLPNKIGNFFDKNHFEVEIIESLNEDGTVIDYTVGKRGIVSFCNTDLNDAITSWNKYCYGELEKETKEKLKNIYDIGLKIFIISLVSSFIFGLYQLSLIFLLIYMMWKFCIYPNLENKYFEDTKESFEIMIEAAERNYSTYDIKLSIALNSYFPIENRKLNINKAAPVLKRLISEIQKTNDIILDIEDDINHISIYNLITDVKNNYTSRCNQLHDSQLEKDIMYYSSNFIKVLNLLSQYINTSYEINKEKTELITNYYIIFEYFNKSLIGSDELVDIAKLKVLTQESKLYKDYLNIKTN